MVRPRSERPALPSIAGHLTVMVAVAAVLGVIVAGLALPFAGLVGIGARNVASTMDSLPAELETDALPQKTRILDAEGNTIATLFDENRVEVPLESISRTMVKAIVAIEDYRFYQHGALDLKGTLRALITNQAAEGTVQGGSSITQQLVKLTLLNQARGKKERQAATADTYARKIRELRYAVAMEQTHSKDWILERYLNIAYFGDGAYGIQAAARHYFNVNASKLNLTQSAMLAGLVKNPTGYDPTNSPDRALERRNVVLERMAQLQVVPEAKAQRAEKKDLGLRVTRSSNGCVESAASWFCDYVVAYLKQDPALGRTPAAREKLLYSGGVVIRTTLDLQDQQAADTAVRDHVDPTDNAIGGLALVEPGTGAVRALSQSRPMGNDKAAGQTFLNYVVPKIYGDSNGFQPGSTFKAFVLAAAIEKGIALNTSIPSPPQVDLPEDSFSVCGDRPYQSYGTWSPQNSTGSGTFNLYTGTQNSVNTFFAQLEQKTGLCKPWQLAKDMGIDLAKSDMVPSFTLGVTDVSPLEMAAAYATFAARGLFCAPRPVTSITDASGNTLKDYPASCRQVVQQSTADAVNDVLRGVQEPGGFGYGAGLALPQASAAKTGTTNDNKSVWFVGYTPNLAAASMIAGANQFGTPITLNGQVIHGSTVYSAFGSTLAGPMWGQAMKAIAPRLPDEDFTAPSATDVKGVLVTVPSTAGMSLEAAQQALADAGFTTYVGGYRDSSVPAGQVAYTDPAGGSLIASGSQITIYQSTGKTPRTNKPGGKGGGGNGGGGGGNNGNGKGQGRR